MKIVLLRNDDPLHNTIDTPPLINRSDPLYRLLTTLLSVVGVVIAPELNEQHSGRHVGVGRIGTTLWGRTQLLECNICTQQSTSHHPLCIGNRRWKLCSLGLLMQRAAVIMKYLSQKYSIQNHKNHALLHNLVKGGIQYPKEPHTLML